MSAIFDIETDGRVVEKTFTRSIQGSSADHKIDNHSVSRWHFILLSIQTTVQVSPKEYLAELEKIGINAKAKNFLVFQVTCC